MAGYIRQDTTGAISTNSIIEADDLNNEFDAVQGAFNAITGHKHDGTSAEGGPIEVVGPAQDVVITASTIRPKTDNAVDLGTSTLEFKDLHLDGTANIDNLVADAGTVAGAAITTVSNTQTLTNKTVNLANNTLVATSAQLAAAITDETGTGSVVFSASPTLTGTPAAPTAAAGTNTTQVATTAHVFAERTNAATLTNKTLTSPVINSGDINTPDIDGGTINGTVIGGSTPAAISGTTGSFSGDAAIHGATVGRGGGAIATNTAVGSGALSSNTTGGSNTANGFRALQFNTEGSNNTANGREALRDNTTGVGNTANGLQALFLNTTGSNNTANGVRALQFNTEGSNNTANGVNALLNNTTGASNTANGVSALLNNTTGVSNTANGVNALRDNTTGTGNTVIGVGAGLALTTGNDNTIIGRIAGTAGLANTVIIGAGPTERMRIDASGNVGIGVTNPQSLLELGGQGNGVGIETRISTVNTSGNSTRYVTTVDADTGFVTLNSDAGSNGSNRGFSFKVGLPERMRITSAGNVGIGTTTDPLGVTTNASGHFIRGGSFASFSGDSNIAIGVNRTGTDGAVMQFRKAGTIVGTIAVTATTTSYNTSSDYRLKEDVQPMVGASDRVLSLKPCNFAWKADGTRVDGFLAHEAQAVVPAAVTGEKDGEEMQAIDHSKLVPLLTAALQDALKEIADLKGRITALEA